MFTVEQIKEAHAKVKSGSDFPNYIRDLIGLGVTGYETYVSDGHTDYYGKADFKTSSPAKYEPLTVAAQSDALQFKADLRKHQQGGTDYPTFCSYCAKSGVDKWEVSMHGMNCTYYDKAGNVLLVEAIPQ